MFFAALQSRNVIIPEFISEWKTDNLSTGSSTDTQVKLPLVSGGTYNFFVDWGDGSSDTITTWDQAETTHTYATAGTYTVRIAGTCYGWQFVNAGDKLKILDISQWGVRFRLGNTGTYFYGCANLVVTATDALDLTGTTDFSFGFLQCTAFNGDVSLWNTIGVTTFSGGFNACTAFQGNGLDQFDVRGCNASTGLNNICVGCTLSTANYDSLLIAWNANKASYRTDLTPNFGSSKYSAGDAATARAALVTYGWTITDGGQV